MPDQAGGTGPQDEKPKITKYAKWQRKYRKKKKDEGYKLVTAYVPEEYDARFRRIIKAIKPERTDSECQLFAALERAKNMMDDGRVVKMWHDADGYHALDAGKHKL